MSGFTLSNTGRAGGLAEPRDPWEESPLRPRGRGPSGVRMATGDESLGMPGALEEAFPRAEHRRRAVRFCRVDVH